MDIEAYALMCARPERVEREELLAMAEYVCGSIMPTLASYFSKVPLPLFMDAMLLFMGAGVQ